MEKSIKKQGFHFKQFIEDSKAILLNPREYFPGMALSGGFSEPIIKALIYGFLIGIIYTIWALIFNSMGIAFGAFWLGSYSWIMAPFSFVIPVFSGLFIGGGIMLGISALFRGNTSYEAGVRVVASLMMITVVRTFFIFTSVINPYLALGVNIVISLWGLYITYLALTLSLKVGKGTKKQSKKSFMTFKGVAKKCWFLLSMSFLNSGLLTLLNIYIVYTAFQQFKGDGWSFFGGLIILTSWLVTIPALILSFLQIRMVRAGNTKKHLFPIIFGVIGILMGFILHNAISWWYLIVLFSLLLMLSYFICERKKQVKESKDQSHLPTEKLQQAKGKVKNTTYSITIVFQIIGLVLLFMIFLSLFFVPVSSSDEHLAMIQQITVSIVFGFLFVMHGTVILAFMKKKKWALKFKYFESYILLGLTVLIFLAGLITDGISFTKTFLVTELSLSLLALLFIYLIYSYKKLKKSMLFILLFTASLVTPNISPAQEAGQMQKVLLLNNNVFYPYTEFYSTDIKDFYHPEKSGNYPSANLFDGYLKTCWVAGSVNKNERNILYIKLPDKIPINELILNIFSGYGKKKELYYANARPKRIKLSILSAYNPEGDITEVATEYLTKKYPIEKQIVLSDTFGIQSFPLNFNKKNLLTFQNENIKNSKSSLKNNDGKVNSAFILKLEITDVYKGTKYNDICISEIFFNDRFVTPYPDRYNQIDSVYVENDSVLMADYADKKGVIIYKDTASTLQVLDWENHSNWVILDYINNAEARLNCCSVTESSLLIDLKNKKIVNDEFKKCTGTSLFSDFIEYDKNGKAFLDADKYKIELK